MNTTNLLIFAVAVLLVLFVMLRCLFRMEDGKPLIPISTDTLLYLASLGLGLLAYFFFAMSAYFVMKVNG